MGKKQGRRNGLLFGLCLKNTEKENEFILRAWQDTEGHGEEQNFILNHDDKRSRTLDKMDENIPKQHNVGEYTLKLVRAGPICIGNLYRVDGIGNVVYHGLGTFVIPESKDKIPQAEKLRGIIEEEEGSLLNRIIRVRPYH